MSDQPSTALEDAAVAFSRARAAASQLATSLAEGTEALRQAGLGDYQRRAEKVIELFRLQYAQLDALARRVEGVDR